MTENLTRRNFLKGASALGIVASIPSLLKGASVSTSENRAILIPPPSLPEADVFVYASTPSGLAAAVEASKKGCSVILACPKKHIGGMLASGLGNLDTRRGDLLGGFVNIYRQAVRDEYDKLKTAGAPGWRIRVTGGAEPSMVERAFETILAEQGKNITLLRDHHIHAAVVQKNRILQVSLETPKGGIIHVSATSYIDASYEGDLAAAAGVPYRVGREAEEEYGEPLAGIRYLNHRTGELIPTPNSGSASPFIQAYCARSVFTTDKEKIVPFRKPDSYEEHLPDLWPLITDFASGRLKNRSLGAALPGRKYELNGSISHATSLNCPGISVAWPEADRKHRAFLEKFHIDHAASFVWILQNHPQIPSQVRSLWKTAGLHKDEFADNNHWPWQIYVRQGRRIEGRAKVTQFNFLPTKKTKRTPVVEHPIAIGDFSFDVHPCQDRRFAVNGFLEGVLSFPKAARTAEPGQLPYAALLPKNIDNLLVPLCLSATHVGMSIVRMEPVWMTTGHIAGIAAAEAKRLRMDVASIDPSKLPSQAGINTDPYKPEFPAYKFLKKY